MFNKLYFLFLVLLMAVNIGCVSHNESSQKSSPKVSSFSSINKSTESIEKADLKPLSINEAQKKIGSKNIEEITTDEVWNKLKVQVYNRVEESSSVGVGLLISNKKVYKLCDSYGGFGIHSLCVADLNKDGVYELLYFYHWGSGMNYSILKGYSDGKIIPGYSKNGSRYALNSEDMFLKKIDDYNIQVKTKYIDIGKVKYANYKGKPVLEVE